MRDVGFFIHRSRVQKLYRQFLRLASDEEERRMVRASFRSQATADAVKDGETILQSVRLARFAPKVEEKREFIWPERRNTLRRRLTFRHMRLILELGQGWPWSRQR